MSNQETISNLSFFLLEKTGSVTGKVVLRKGMLKAQQVALFGRYLGKGAIEIDGSTEMVQRWVTRGFGADFEIMNDISWKDL